ncbi:DUF5615 family PIN-like protein [bacterium]|nr:DUF5615 family PIN-like protein [bacterium]
MKFKLDENFSKRMSSILKNSGYEVTTVREEDLQGCSDDELYKKCSKDKMCLVTLDLDFANVLRFPPQEVYGIVVIRVPRNPTLRILELLVEQLVESLNKISVKGQLWVVEVGRIRIHQTDIED